VAAAALNVLTHEKDGRYYDFDTPAGADEVFGELREKKASRLLRVRERLPRQPWLPRGAHLINTPRRGTLRYSV